jgi:hypothetical protein
MLNLLVARAVRAALTAEGNMKTKTEFVNILKSALKQGNPAFKCNKVLFGQKSLELVSKESFQPHKAPIPTWFKTNCA